jgi:hypothetical protein
MDEDYNDELCEPEVESGYQWRWSLLGIRVLTFVASLFGVTGRLFSGVAEDLVENLNYRVERDQFAAEAGRELETILGEEE